MVCPFSLALRVLGLEESSPHGEVLALAALALVTLILGGSHLVFSDYLQSVRLIRDVRTESLTPNFWSHKLARAFYRWLSSLPNRNEEVVFEHAIAHTSADDVASHLNNRADRTASFARSHPSSRLIGPPLTVMVPGERLH